MNGKLSFWDWWDSLSDQEKKETGRCMECGTHECSDGCIEYLTDGVL